MTLIAFALGFFTGAAVMFLLLAYLIRLDEKP